MAYDIRYKDHIGFSDLYKKMTCIEVIDIYDWQLLQSFNTLSRQKLFCHCVINHIQYKFANIFTLSTGNTYVNKCTGNLGSIFSTLLMDKADCLLSRSSRQNFSLFLVAKQSFQS